MISLHARKLVIVTDHSLSCLVKNSILTSRSNCLFSHVIHITKDLNDTLQKVKLYKIEFTEEETEQIVKVYKDFEIEVREIPEEIVDYHLKVKLAFEYLLSKKSVC